ncbi:MAG: ABC transporter ATP-binding protein [Bacteroidota bacterium]
MSDPSTTPSGAPRERLSVALRRIYALAVPYRRRLMASLLLTALAALIFLAVPLGLRTLLDAVFVDGDRGLLNLIALGLLGLFVAQAALSFAGYYGLEWTGERVLNDLRQRLYQHLHVLDVGFFANQRIGDLTSRLSSDVLAVRNALTTALVQALTQSIMLIGSVALMVGLNQKMSLFIAVVVPPAALMARYFGRKIRDLMRDVHDRYADATAVAEEALSATRVVKAFAREDYETARYKTATEAVFKTAIHALLYRQLFWSSVGMAFLIALVAIFWYGGTEVLDGRLTAGDMVAFIFYAFNIARSVGAMSQLYTVFNSAAGASERLFELLDTRPTVQDAPDAVPLPPAQGAVRFEGVHFSYDERQPVLQDVTLNVQPGETVALVGPSGSGKTTLLNLIPRFYDPKAGRIRVDGFDVATVQGATLRQQIALVPQETYLFGTTIRENIRYGRLEATDAEVEAAAEAANASAFVTALPDGYESQVGERGVKLSGGQRQRIAIARALLRDAPLLLLDEATSSLDSASEALVQEALERLMENRTTFIIAHRLSTVQHADRIVVLHHGRVVQQGTHAELANIPGLYRELATHQFAPEASVS